MITNTTEIKKLLQITATDYDVLIEELIPIIWDNICQYLGKHFLNNIYYEGEFIFNSNTIDFQDSDYTIEYPIGTDIYVKYSNYNDGYYTVKSILNGVITVDKYLITETVSARIFGVKYPNNNSFLKKIIAEMIDYNINKDKYNVISETLGEASVSFKNNGMFNGYPMDIITKLDIYR